MPEAGNRGVLLQGLTRGDVIPGIAAPRFWLMTQRGTPELIEARRKLGRTALDRLDAELADRDFLAEDLSIADLSMYAYTHAANDAGLELSAYPNVVRWLARVESAPRFTNDLVPYPENATRGRSRSIYD